MERRRGFNHELFRFDHFHYGNDGDCGVCRSGAMLGIRKKMDLFGVCVLGVTTSVGGGAIRDVTLGIIPPGMFRRPIYTIVAVWFHWDCLLFFISGEIFWTGVSDSFTIC